MSLIKLKSLFINETNRFDISRVDKNYDHANLTVADLVPT